MSTLDYIAGASVEQNISAHIALEREKQYQAQLTSLVNRHKAALEERDARLQSQIAYTEKLERDLQRALAQLQKVGAPPIVREAAGLSPHILRQQQEAEERRRREAARIAAMPTPQELAEYEANRKRGKRIFLVILAVIGLYAASDDIIGHIEKENYVGYVMRTNIANRLYPLVKPKAVTLEAYGCLNCHFWESEHSFRDMEHKVRTIKSKSDREITLQRYREAIAQKSAVVRFELNQKETEKLLSDVTTGRFPPI